MDETREIVYQAIREVAFTDDPYGYSVKNDICYDIAFRAVEIAREKWGNQEREEVRDGEK